MAALEFTLSISPCMGCKICPQSNLGKAYQSQNKIFSVAAYVEIIDKLPQDVEVHFSGFSEPFLNPTAPQMIKYASDLGRKIYLYSTLMGLRADDIHYIKDSHFHLVKIHAPDRKHLLVNAKVWLKQYDLFLATGHPHTIMSLASDPQDVDGDIAGGIVATGNKLELLDRQLSRAGNNWETPHLTGPIKCTANRWHNNVVLPNGDVVVCCMDYSLTMPIGNLLQQSWQEVWHNAERYARNSNPPDTSICRDCEWAAKGDQ